MGLILDLDWHIATGIECTLIGIDIDPSLIRRYRVGYLPLNWFSPRIL
jgi:hypothetical protein